MLANPLRSWRFAEVLGHLAKNARVDARVPAGYSRLDTVRAVPPKSEKLRDLSDLVALRREVDCEGAARLFPLKLVPCLLCCLIPVGFRDT